MKLVRPIQSILLVMMPLAVAYTFWVGPAKGFMEPELARIIFFHVPCALLSSVWVIWSGVCGIQVLRTRSHIWDQRNAAALEMGFLMAILAMVTGILFSRVQWGEWWHWDPRQTSFLMVLLILAGALAVRGGFADEQKRTMATAGYSSLAMVPLIFLIFVYPRIGLVASRSAHPSQTLPQNQLDIYYRLGFYGMLILMLGLTISLYIIRTRVGLLEVALNQHGLDKARGGSPASHSVVRPVDLSQPPGPTA